MKWTLDKVKAYADKSGYSVLAESFHSCKLPISIQCPVGHTYITKWAAFALQGQRCRQCFYHRRTLTINEVRTRAATLGFSLLSAEYHSQTEKLRFECKAGHQFQTSWNRFLFKPRCSTCDRATRATQKTDIVNKIVNEFGYQLVSFTTLRARMHLYCPVGHSCMVSLEKFKFGSRCSKCHDLSRTNALRLAAAQLGYELLVDNGNHGVEVQCEAGHRYTTRGHLLLKGTRCNVCNQHQRLSIDNIRQEALKDGYRILTNDYVNNKQHLEIKCPKGHVYRAKWNTFVKGCRCPKCNLSKGETELLQLVKSLVGKHEVRERDRRTLGGGYELDILVPAHHFAIEYGGMFWHSSASPRMHQHYHQNKMKKCEALDIKLFTVMEKQWLERRPEIERAIRQELSRPVYTIGPDTITEDYNGEVRSIKYMSVGDCIHLAGVGADVFRFQRILRQFDKPIFYKEDLQYPQAEELAAIGFVLHESIEPVGDRFQADLYLHNKKNHHFTKHVDPDGTVVTYDCGYRLHVYKNATGNYPVASLLNFKALEV